MIRKHPQFLMVLAALLGLSFARVNHPAPALKDAFSGLFLIGAALDESQFSGRDTLGSAIVANQFNSVTPENVLKWENVHPEPDRYNFGPADRYVEFGERHHMFIVGHTLIWHNQTPSWVFGQEGAPEMDRYHNLKQEEGKRADRETLLGRMHDHITTVVSRYKGRVNGWDVVNEALNGDGTLRQTPWMKGIGEDYLIKAYEFAQEADPGAELYYNDFSTENPMKRAGAIALVKNLQAHGIRLAGVGIQGHYRMDWPSTVLLDSAITDFSRLGVKVMITELDVDVLPAATWNRDADVRLRASADPRLNPYASGLPDSLQRALGERYADLFGVFTRHAGVLSRVTFWGVRDGDSWLNNWPVPGRVNYPLLFDRNGACKAAYDSVMNVAMRRSDHSQGQN